MTEKQGYRGYSHDNGYGRRSGANHSHEQGSDSGNSNLGEGHDEDGSSSDGSEKGREKQEEPEGGFGDFRNSYS